MNKGRIAAIIQARMGSERLPGKALADICGKPLLWHIVERLKRSKLIGRTAIITTKRPEDDAIEDLCRAYNVDFYRGDAEDVLDRYYRAAKLCKAKTIARITGDCPMIDPHVVDKVAGFYIKNAGELDYVTNSLKSTYPRGLDTEVFSFRALEKAWREAREAYEREHVTPYIYEHPDRFRIENVENDRDLSGMRWTVDEGPDLEFVREVYKRLYRDKKVFLTADVLRLLEKEPHLADMNRDVKQKALHR
jgi:spore coat polysaccharide biosynthesis protein SpsF